MLQNISFRRKILLLPTLAAIGFLLVLGLVRLEGQHNEEVTGRIENGYFPALNLGRDLETTLGEVERKLEEAAGVIAVDGVVYFHTDRSYTSAGGESVVRGIYEFDLLQNDFVDLNSPGFVYDTRGGAEGPARWPGLMVYVRRRARPRSRGAGGRPRWGEADALRARGGRVPPGRRAQRSNTVAPPPRPAAKRA